MDYYVLSLTHRIQSYGVWYANKTEVFVDGKWQTINMAYIRIRHGLYDSISNKMIRNPIYGKIKNVPTTNQLFVIPYPTYSKWCFACPPPKKKKTSPEKKRRAAQGLQASQLLGWGIAVEPRLVGYPLANLQFLWGKSPYYHGEIPIFY